jgi:hypothetical protein
MSALQYHSLNILRLLVLLLSWLSKNRSTWPPYTGFMWYMKLSRNSRNLSPYNHPLGWNVSCVPGDPLINIWFSKSTCWNISTGGTDLSRTLIQPMMVTATPPSPDVTLTIYLLSWVQQLQGDSELQRAHSHHRYKQVQDPATYSTFSLYFVRKRFNRSIKSSSAHLLGHSHPMSWDTLFSSFKLIS